MLESISIQAGQRELVGWSGAGESELAGALAGSVWGRYGSFRGQPRIAAMLAWSVADRWLVARRHARDRALRADPPPPDGPNGRDTSRDMSESAGQPA